MLFSFRLGIAAVIAGGFAIRRGNVDTGKLSIIGSAVVAAAPAVAFACFKIFGIDSNSTVTDDSYRAGRLIIPAGTEVRGTAQVNRQRDFLDGRDLGDFIGLMPEAMDPLPALRTRSREVDRTHREVRR